MKLIYPVCFYEDENDTYTADIVDLPGCVTFGHSLADAIEMAVDAASGWILSSLEDGENIPKPSPIEDIKPEHDNAIISYILLDMESYAEKYGDKAIRKNLTIPAWLNTLAEKHNINFSQVLQSALQEELNEYLYETANS